MLLLPHYYYYYKLIIIKIIIILLPFYSCFFSTAALQTQSALHRLASTNSLVVGEALKGIRFFGAKWKSLRSAKNHQPRKATEKVLAHNDRRDCLHDQPWALVAPTCVEFIRSLFPHCEYEKHISEAYSPPGFFIICGSRASKGVLKLAFLTHLNDGVKVVTIERSKILDNVQKFRQEISLALQIDDDSLRDKTGKSLKKLSPLGIGHAGKYTPQMAVVGTTT